MAEEADVTSLGELLRGTNAIYRAYLQMQVDADLHNLWLQCCQAVVHAAWVAHDAAVEGLSEVPEAVQLQSVACALVALCNQAK